MDSRLFEFNQANKAFSIHVNTNVFERDPSLRHIPLRVLACALAAQKPTLSKVYIHHVTKVAAGDYKVKYRFSVVVRGAPKGEVIELDNLSNLNLEFGAFTASSSVAPPYEIDENEINSTARLLQLGKTLLQQYQLDPLPQQGEKFQYESPFSVEVDNAYAELCDAYASVWKTYEDLYNDELKKELLFLEKLVVADNGRKKQSADIVALSSILTDEERKSFGEYRATVTRDLNALIDYSHVPGARHTRNYNDEVHKFATLKSKLLSNADLLLHKRKFIWALYSVAKLFLAELRAREKPLSPFDRDLFNKIFAPYFCINDKAELTPLAHVYKRCFNESLSNLNEVVERLSNPDTFAAINIQGIESNSVLARFTTVVSKVSSAVSSYFSATSMHEYCQRINELLQEQMALIEQPSFTLSAFEDSVRKTNALPCNHEMVASYQAKRKALLALIPTIETGFAKAKLILFAVNALISNVRKEQVQREQRKKLEHDIEQANKRVNALDEAIGRYYQAILVCLNAIPKLIDATLPLCNEMKTYIKTEAAQREFEDRVSKVVTAQGLIKQGVVADESNRYASILGEYNQITEISEESLSLRREHLQQLELIYKGFEGLSRELHKQYTELHDFNKRLQLDLEEIKKTQIAEVERSFFHRHVGKIAVSMLLAVSLAVLVVGIAIITGGIAPAAIGATVLAFAPTLALSAPAVGYGILGFVTFLGGLAKGILVGLGISLLSDCRRKQAPLALPPSKSRRGTVVLVMEAVNISDQGNDSAEPKQSVGELTIAAELKRFMPTKKGSEGSFNLETLRLTTFGLSERRDFSMTTSTTPLKTAVAAPSP